MPSGASVRESLGDFALADGLRAPLRLPERAFALLLRAPFAGDGGVFMPRTQKSIAYFDATASAPEVQSG
jgi:hypothetical protein